MKLLGGFAVALILLISPSPAHESWIAARSAIPLRALAGLDHSEKPGCAGGDKDSGMVRRPLDPVAARIALEECRRQAQKCIDESVVGQGAESGAERRLAVLGRTVGPHGGTSGIPN